MIAAENRDRLTRLALDSIEHGVRYGVELTIDPLEWPAKLREIQASFVTLQTHGELRGCIGSLVATRPLVRDVSQHAHAAALKDPRFDAMTLSELSVLEIHISVLSNPTPIDFSSESELLELVHPGEDGLVLQAGSNRATFLPDVWQKLPEPGQFLAQLKLKAGLAKDYWSDDLIIERYTTESW